MRQLFDSREGLGDCAPVAKHCATPALAFARAARWHALAAAASQLVAQRWYLAQREEGTEHRQNHSTPESAP